MQSPPMLHPVPIALAMVSLVLTVAEVKVPGLVAEWGPFINSGLILACLGWSMRELWKMRRQIPLDIETAVTKAAIRQDVAMGAMEQRITYDIGRLERRVDAMMDHPKQKEV